MSLFKNKQEAENLEEFRDITDDVIEGDFVPYSCHWDANTIVTKNGEVLQTIKITGFMRSIAENSSGDISLRDKIREAIMMCVDSTKYAIWIHTIRRKKSLKTDGEYKRDFSGYLNHFWNDKNDWEHKFVNEVYITIVREGREAKTLDPEILAMCLIPGKINRYFDDTINKARDELSEITAKILPVLSIYGARLLGVEKRGDCYYSEICEFLGKIASLRAVEFPLGNVDISHQLSDYDVTFGHNAMEVRMRSDGKRRFGAIITVREYRELEVDVLDLLLQIPSEFIISQSFEFISAKAALKEYTYQKDILITSKSQKLYEKIGLKNIIESNKGRNTDFGKHQLNIFLLADSIKSLENAVANAARALASFGMTPMREDVKFEECYWAQLPGNFEFISRMRPLNTARIGGFANLSNVSTGNEHGNHWGPAVTTFNTAARTPYFFNFHTNDNGHTIIVGQPGAGKNVLLNFMLSEARKFDNRLFFFDVNRRAEIFLRSLGGEYYNPYPGADDRSYAKAGMNPFELEDTEENRRFLCDWLMSLIDFVADAEFSGLCAKVVSDVMALAKSERHIRSCIGLMRNYNPAAADLFHSWTEGELAGIFADNHDSLVLDNKIIGFEMGDVINHSEAVIPVTLYLLHRIKSVLDGQPAIIVMTEAWDLLDNKVFGPNIAGLLDYWRANNTMAILATDKAGAIMGSNINRILIDKVATQVYLPDSEEYESYETSFNLTDNEVAYLVAMNTEDLHFMIKRDHETIVCELGISDMNDIMAVLSSEREKLNIMEEMIKKNGIAHTKWMPAFLANI